MHIGIYFVHILCYVVIECTNYYLVEKAVVFESGVKNISCLFTEISTIFDFDNIIEVTVALEICEYIVEF